MEFGLLMTDILVYVSCKFEIHILKIALVISENVRIAFLYVLSILRRLIAYHASVYQSELWCGLYSQYKQKRKLFNDIFCG